MKKFVVLTAVLLVTALGITACAVPSMGKLEIVGTSEPAEAAAGGTEGEAESADQSEAAAAPADLMLPAAPLLFPLSFSFSSRLFPNLFATSFAAHVPSRARGR